jgi:hypothetical protein
VKLHVHFPAAIYPGGTVTQARARTPTLPKLVEAYACCVKAYACRAQMPHIPELQLARTAVPIHAHDEQHLSCQLITVRASYADTWQLITERMEMFDGCSAPLEDWNIGMVKIK